MTAKQINKLILLLEEKGIEFDKGLSEFELGGIEKEFAIIFPADLKILLKTKLPVSNGFVHWRYGLNSTKGKIEIEQRLGRPLRGMLFDIKGNNFWLQEWGNKPPDFAEQKEIATTKLKNSPILIPIYSHRYIPSEPQEIGNPIFSIYQTDIIYYGFDLADYLSKEFNLKLAEDFGEATEPKEIEFWSKLVELNV